MKQIEKILYDDGFRNHKGNKLSQVTMAHIIRNPKYKGYFCGNKVGTEDMFTKKIVFKPESEWVMLEDKRIVPAIVSEEIWEKANAVLAIRGRDVKQRQNQCNRLNLMVGKLYCEHCGRLYHRKMSKSNNGTPNSAWVWAQHPARCGTTVRTKSRRFCMKHFGETSSMQIPALRCM